MELLSDRPLTVDNQTFPAGLPFTVEDWRGMELIRAGVARHAHPPDVLYETQSPEQNALDLGDQGVTCLCLTRNRREWLPKAIESYLAQSYKPRELLIVADGEEVRDLIPEREDIRLIHVEEGRTIGEKRNFGVSHARGKYIAHWDDDDYSAPDRILEQVYRLRESAKSVTGYPQIDFTDGSGWWRYTGDKYYAPGSSLLYERAWAARHPFDAIQVGEDGRFVTVAREHGRIVTTPANGMLAATIHPGNTSPRQLTGEMWTKLERTESGLTVIVPSKTSSNVLACIDGLRTCGEHGRVVVIDDFDDYERSTVRNCIPQWKHPTELVKGEKPFIFSRNMNIGIRAAGRDDVLLLNDDAILKTPGGFSLLQEESRKHPEFGVIAATTNAVGNSNQLPHGIGLREDPRMVCFIAVFIPRTTLDKIGWLDDRFIKYGHEDDDFCYRVRRAGLKIGIHDGVFVDHASLKSTFRGDPLNTADLEGGREIFINKWGSYPL